MSLDLWATYEPDGRRPWDLRRVVHLHRRAAFAGTWGELHRDLADGPGKSVGRLLAGTVNPHAPADFDATAALLADSAVAQADIGRLKAAWFYRLLFSPDPMREKLTLVWHDHFATANRKVGDVGLMRTQNDTLRTHAAGTFGGLLNAAVRDPALLVFLDAPANRKGHPNENLARELMELFTVGLGHFTEADVKEAARALTGWSADDGRFVTVPDQHDPGPKTILGHTAEFDGGRLVEVLLAHPGTAVRVAVKLCRQFFGDAGVSPTAVKQLADGLRDRNLDVAWAVSTVLRSRLFFDDANLRTRVLSPAEFVVGAARALELFDPAPSTLALADWSARMGQDLFDPPNVGGWPGGRAWVHTRGLVARANFAAALVGGRGTGRSVPHDPAALAIKHGFAAADAVTFHHRLLFGTDPDPAPRTVAALLASPAGLLG